MTTILQVDRPFNGTSGAEMAEAMTGLAQGIASEMGLIWKIWTDDRACHGPSGNSDIGGHHLACDADDIDAAAADFPSQGIWTLIGPLPVNQAHAAGQSILYLLPLERFN